LKKKEIGKYTRFKLIENKKFIKATTKYLVSSDPTTTKQRSESPPILKKVKKEAEEGGLSRIEEQEQSDRPHLGDVYALFVEATRNKNINDLIRAEKKAARTLFRHLGSFLEGDNEVEEGKGDQQSKKISLTKSLVLKPSQILGKNVENKDEDGEDDDDAAEEEEEKEGSEEGEPKKTSSFPKSKKRAHSQQQTKPSPRISEFKTEQEQEQEESAPPHKRLKVQMKKKKVAPKK